MFRPPWLHYARLGLTYRSVFPSHNSLRSFYTSRSPYHPLLAGPSSTFSPSNSTGPVAIDRVSSLAYPRYSGLLPTVVYDPDTPCTLVQLHGLAIMASSRWWLYVQAVFWRFLMRLGMIFHNIPHPRPPSPTFSRSFPSGSSKVVLQFYCPPGYSRNHKAGCRLPVVVNFHGGGFTLGGPSDDSRWAQAILSEVGAVVVSVGYRRAPEHPFPAAVDDGVLALQYLASHAAELGLDISRIALSGFSAGGNLAVTVPLRLRDMIVQSEHERWLSRADSTVQLVSATANDLQIVALFCWYPILDFAEPREHRRAMSIEPNKTLPSFFTTLFDESYLPDLEQRKSPYASPVHATDDALRDSLPQDIFFFICEWDMLLNEGQLFCRRLQDINKHVRAMMVEKARHAWDKSPNPFRNTTEVNILYKDACADMKAIFEK